MSLFGTYEFGEFRLDCSKRRLLSNGKPIALTPKAFDLLAVLIEHRQQPLKSQELIPLVWTEKIVTNNNFDVTLNSVRRALGESASQPRFIVRSSTGYRFAGDVREAVDGNSNLGVGSRSREAPLAPWLSALDKGLLRYAAQGVIACSFYSALVALAVILEVAYQFDHFGSKALKLAPVVFFWMFATSVIGLFADRILTLQRRTFGLTISTSTFIIATAVLFAGLCMFLPSLPITEATFETYPARAAYLKDAGSFLALAFFFLLLPSHFVFAAQHESAVNLPNDERGVTSEQPIIARRTLYPRFWFLCLLLILFALIAIAGTAHLLDHLKPGPYMNLFVELLYLREILYFGLGTYCLVWYYRAINRAQKEHILLLA